jgi:hypothetical protein
MRLIALVVLITLLGCTHYSYPFSVDGLKEQGYQLMHSGPTHQVWAKETRDDGRRVHICMVPAAGGSGYVWDASVSVDGREVWNYSIGGASSQPSLLMGIDCRASDPLPEGRVSLRTLYKYWH